MKVSELTGAHLDYWTARAEGYKPWWSQLSVSAKRTCTVGVRHEDGAVTAKFYRPSTDWAQGGPLICKHRLDLAPDGQQYMATVPGGMWSFGDTPLQAVCRAVVRAKLGDEVEEIGVPE